MNLLDRFMDKVAMIPEHGCWEWLGATDGRYGQIHAAGKREKAHRIAYRLFRGGIPPGGSLDHLCRNTHCVNPAHLEIVSHRENMLRGISPVAICAAKTHCAHGHLLTGTTVHIERDGSRRCVTCSRENARQRRARAQQERK